MSVPGANPFVPYSENRENTRAFREIQRWLQDHETPPAMTTAQRNALPRPKPGLIINNITTNKLNWFNNTGVWKEIQDL